MESLRIAFLRFMRLPPEPSPPAGSPESVKVFRAGRNYYRFQMGLWFLKQALFAVVLVVLLIFLSGGQAQLMGRAAVNALIIIKIIGAIIFLIQLPFSYLLVRFDYELRWYIVTDRSLRLRYGIQWVRELTMTFANIQQITVHQGPIQRLLGISDLEVQTAGGGGMVVSPHGGHQLMEQMHIARFRGVDNAEEIRNLILDRVRRYRDTGLGDPDESTVHHAQATANPLLDAARSLLSEAKALRAAWK